MNSNSLAPLSSQGAPPPLPAPAADPIAVAAQVQTRRAAAASTAAEQQPRVAEPPKPRIDFDPAVLRKNLQEAIEQLNQQMASSGRTLGFALDRSVATPIVTVKNSTTGEVIRQIPSEAIVKVAHTLDALKGMLHDASS